MRKRLRRRRSVVLASAAVTVGAAAAGLAYAGIPGADGTINGCYKPSGAFRMIDTEAGAKCTKWEKPVSWNQRGPAGPEGTPGAQGEAGPRGEQGERGPQGVPGGLSATDLYMRTATVVGKPDLGNSAGYVGAECDRGDAVISGGFLQPFQPQAKVEGSFPENSVVGDGTSGPRWLVQYQYLPGGEPVSAYAICVRLHGELS